LECHNLRKWIDRLWHWRGYISSNGAAALGVALELDTIWFEWNYRICIKWDYRIFPVSNQLQHRFNVLECDLFCARHQFDKHRVGNFNGGAPEYDVDGRIADIYDVLLVPV
jgi:hypothetical protein